MMKKLFSLSLVCSSCLFGLGFGSMGNTSAGLGDSGVALRKSAWGIYYNPALLASDNRGKFGYSFGANIEEMGLDTLVTTFLNANNSNNIQDLYNKLQANPNHTLAINSQNGIVIQITGGAKEIRKAIGEEKEEVIEKRNPYGAFTIAGFASAFAFGDLAISQNQNQQLDATGNLSGVALIEVPVGWGWRFETNGGDVSIGASVKYMGALGISSNLNAKIPQNGEMTFSYTTPKNPRISHWFGIDLGLLYTPIEGLNLGFVAKNVNVPSFDIGGRTLKIMPQFRAGLSYEFAKYFALTFDADLAPNRILFEDSPKTQMIGGGFLMDFKYIDLRFGLMGDIANKFEQGVIMTGGINLLGFLDVAVQASSKMFDVQGYKVPNFVTLKIGGSFTF